MPNKPSMQALPHGLESNHHLFLQCPLPSKIHVEQATTNRAIWFATWLLVTLGRRTVHSQQRTAAMILRLPSNSLDNLARAPQIFRKLLNRRSSGCRYLLRQTPGSYTYRSLLDSPVFSSFLSSTSSLGPRNKLLLKSQFWCVNLIFAFP